MNLDEYTSLRREVERKQREADRAQGALEQVKKQLKEEFACTSLEEAEKLLRQLERKCEKQEALLDKELAEWKKKYGGSLDD